MTASRSHVTDFAPEQQTTLGALVHLLGFLTSVIAPTLVYSVADDQFTRHNAARALNWQLFVLGVIAVLAAAVFGLELVTNWIVAAVLLVFAPLVVNALVSLRATRMAFGGNVGTYPIAPQLF